MRAYDRWRHYTIVRLLARWILRLLMLFLLALLWQALVEWGAINQVILAKPTSIVDQIGDIVFASFFWEHFAGTINGTLAGFGVGSSIGFLLAATIVLFPRTKPFVSEYVVAFEAIPKVALVPVIVVWFGFGSTSKVVLASMIAFFPVFLTTLAGIAAVAEDDHKLLSSLRANRVQRLYMLQLPNALPNIFGGLKIALANALVGTILAEFLFGNVGLGFLIKLYNSQVKIAELFAVMFSVSIAALFLFYMLDVVQRRFAFWVRPLDQGPTVG